MFHHVTIHVRDLEASERFYTPLLETLGHPVTNRATGRVGWRDFWIEGASSDMLPTARLHIGFAAPSIDAVDRFWQEGVEHGYTDGGAPGPRPEYGRDYYGAFLLDPDGLSAEAVRHDSLRRGGAIDHLWIRVADVAAARRFYLGLARDAGWTLAADLPERARFTGGNGSFSVVAGEPARNVHMAFATGTRRDRLRDPDGNVVELLGRDSAR
ncbi:MAG TPA: VOC family protein [Gaiellales bacterium]|nr:VOC family protein [Gaiellales bacterium]